MSCVQKRLWLAVCLAVLLTAADSPAQLSDNSLLVTGFVSQGYLNTSENNYLVPRSVNGTAEFTEAAITVVAQPMDRLRVGIQLLARNFGNTGNDFVTVDWAYGDYRYQDWLGVRLGKVKMPFGFYNEGRDVDMLRTSIFLPQSIYSEQLRDFFLAYEGGGAYGNLAIGDFGDLDYHIYGGTLNVPDAAQGFWRDLYQGVGEALARPVENVVAAEYGREAAAEFDEVRDPVVTFPWIYGGALFWNTPVSGLRLGASGMQGRFNVQGRLRYDVLLDTGDPGGVPDYLPYTIELDQTTAINHLAVFGGEYLRDRWSLVGEYYHDDFDGDTSHGWYVQTGWQAGRRLTLAAYYSDARSSQRSGNGRSTAIPDYYDWQKDLTISARYDLTDHWLFKLEHHFIDGVGLTGAATGPFDPDDVQPQRWGMIVAKTTFYF